VRALQKSDFLKIVQHGVTCYNALIQGAWQQGISYPDCIEQFEDEINDYNQMCITINHITSIAAPNEAAEAEAQPVAGEQPEQEQDEEEALSAQVVDPAALPLLATSVDKVTY